MKGRYFILCTNFTTTPSRDDKFDEFSQECRFDVENRCLLHGCQAKVTNLRTKEWGYIARKKCYGWIYRKTINLTCLYRSRDQPAKDISSYSESIT